MAALAVKTFGPLSGAETSLTKALIKIEAHKQNVAEAVVTCCQDTQGKLRDWIESARAAIDQEGRNKKLDAPVPVAELPYTQEDVKALLKTAQEAQKNVRLALPKRVPKAKEEPAPTDAPRKRRRTKSAA